jgi:hypothetical protein
MVLPHNVRKKYVTCRLFGGTGTEPHVARNDDPQNMLRKYNLKNFEVLQVQVNFSGPKRMVRFVLLVFAKNAQKAPSAICRIVNQLKCDVIRIPRTVTVPSNERETIHVWAMWTDRVPPKFFLFCDGCNTTHHTRHRSIATTTATTYDLVVSS